MLNLFLEYILNFVHKFMHSQRLEFYEILNNLNNYLWNININLNQNNNLKIIDIISNNYLSNDWNKFLQNNVEIWVFEELLCKVDDYELKKYFNKNIFLILEKIIILFEKVYLEIILDNKIIIIWINNSILSSIYKNNINLYYDKYYNNILELINNLHINYLLLPEKKTNVINSTFGLLYDVKITSLKFKNNYVNNINYSHNINYFRKHLLINNNINIKYDFFALDAVHYKMYSKLLNKNFEFFYKKNLWFYSKINDLQWWKFDVKNSFLWFNKNHWIFGLLKKKNQLEDFKNQAFFKYLGGYTFWYMSAFKTYYNMDTNQTNINFSKIETELTTKWKLYYMYHRNIWGRREIVGWIKLPVFRYWTFNAKWRLFTKMNMDIYDIRGNFLKKLFKDFFVSEIIWDTKKLIMKSRVKADAFFKKDDLLYKQILVRRPAIKKYGYIDENFPKFDKKDFFKKDKYDGRYRWVPRKDKYGEWDYYYEKYKPYYIRKWHNTYSKWNYRFKTFIENRKPWVFKFNVYLDIKSKINIKKLLRYSDRGVLLLNKSFEYSKSTQKLIQSLWIKNYSTNVLYNKDNKYILLSFNKIYNKYNINLISDNLNNLIIQVNKEYIHNVKLNNDYKNVDYKNVDYWNFWELLKKKKLNLKKFFWEKFFWEKNFEYKIFFSKYKKFLPIPNFITEPCVPKDYLTGGTAVYTNDKNMVFFYNNSANFNLIEKLTVKRDFEHKEFFWRWRESGLNKLYFVDYNIWYVILEFFYIKNGIFDFLALTNSRALAAAIMPETIEWTRIWTFQDNIDAWGQQQWASTPWFFFKIKVCVPKSIFYETSMNNNNKLLKLDVLQNYINFHKKNILLYENLYNFEQRKKYVNNKIIDILNNINNIIKYIIIVFKFIIVFLIINNKIILLLSLLLFYLIIIIIILLLLKTSIPLNNVYGFRYLKKKFFDDELKKILENDFIFTMEQKFIYSLNNTKDWKNNNNTWVKLKLDNKFTEYIKLQLKKKYNIFYKKLVFEENFEKILNNKRYQMSISSWVYFFFFFRNNSYWIRLLKFIGKLLDGRFFNWNRVLLKETNDMNTDVLNIFLKIPKFELEYLFDSTIFKKIIFYFKFFFGLIIIWFRVYWGVLNTYLGENWLKKELHEDAEDQLLKRRLQINNELLYEIENLIIDIKSKERKSIKWYKGNLDYMAIRFKDFEKDNLNNFKIDSIEDKYVVEDKYIIDDKENIGGFKEKTGKFVITPEMYLKNFDGVIANFRRYLGEKEKEFFVNSLMLDILNNVNLKKLEENKKLNYILFLLNYKNNIITKMDKDIEKDFNIINFFNDWDIDFFKLRCLNLYLFNILLDNITNSTMKDSLLLKINTILNLNLEKELNWYEKYIKILFFNNSFNVKYSFNEQLNLPQKLNFENHFNYILYRWYTTMGDRIYYFFYLITTIYSIWVNSLKKIRNNEYSLQYLFNKIFVNWKYLFKKIYWEYILITTNKRDNLHVNLISVIKFVILIITPLLIYFAFLMLLLIIYSNIYFIINKYYYFKIKQRNIHKKLLKKNVIYYIISLIIKFLFSLIKYIITDLKTGKSIFENVYIFIYLYLKKIEKMYLVIKYIWKNNTRKNSVKKIIYWLYLNIKIIKNKIKIKIKKKRKNNEKKKKLNKTVFFWIWLKQNKIRQELSIIVNEFTINILHFFLSKYVILYLDKNVFVFLKKILFLFIQNKNKSKKLKIKKIKIYPFFFKKIIYNYLKKRWDDHNKSSLDDILSMNVISIYIKKQQDRNNWYLKNFLKRKSDKYIIKKENELEYKEPGEEEDKLRSAIGWDQIYILLNNIREHQLQYWYEIFYDLENLYWGFKNSKRTQRWSPFRILKLSYKILNKKKKLKKYLNKKKYEEKNISRNIFFYKKWKKRKKIIYIYLFKGFINWLSYLMFKKVIFSEIKNLKNEKVKLKFKKRKKYKYYVKNINSSIYINSLLKKVPPQLWLLSILYDLYYFNIIFYIIYNKDYIYHNIPEAPKGIRVKWKLNPYFGALNYSGKGMLGYWSFLLDPNNLYKVATTKPISIGLRYLAFFMEALSSEKWSKKKIWADISLLFGITYDSSLDALKYEGRVQTPIDLKYDRSHFDFYSNLLLLEFEKIERLKNAFHFKISFDYMFADKAIHVIKREDPDIEEKERLFSWHDAEYDENYGKYEWDDITKRDAIRWRFEKHIVHFKNKEGKKLLDEVQNLNDLLECINAIYYDITLKELISMLHNLLILKQKYVKDINIQIEPSLIININYEQYKNFFEKETHMNLDWMFKIFEDKKLNSYKNIKMTRIYNTDDMLADFKDLNRFFFGSYRAAELGLYEIERKKKEDVIKRQYEEYKIVIELVISTDFIEVWNNIISKRLSDDADIIEFKTNYLNKKWLVSENADNLKKSIIFLNVTKWNWKQWLHFDLTEAEKLKFYKKNTILLNEKYNIWSLKLAPVRMKVPIKLKLELKRFYQQSVMEGQFSMDKNFLVPIKLTNDVIRDYLRWQKFQKFLESKYNKKNENAFLWWIVPEKNDIESKKLRKKYRKPINHLKGMFGAYSYFDLKTIIKVCWDFLWYYEDWTKDEEFPLEEWIQMRLRASVEKDIKYRQSKYFGDDYIYILYTIFSPNSYVNWFNKTIIQYKLLKYIAILNLLWVIYFLGYCPGEFMYNIWLLVIPCWISVYFFYLWFFIKKYLKEDLKGKDLYLYKYQASKRKPMLPRGKLKYYYNIKQWDAYLKEYDIDGEEKTWRTNRYIYVKNNHNTFRREYFLPILVFAWIFIQFYTSEMWRVSKIRGYDYYKKYEEEFAGPDGYRRRIWKGENWERLSSGGNAYNVWYINYFRKKKNIMARKLDYQEGKLSYDPIRIKLYSQNLAGKKEYVIYDVNRADFYNIWISLKFEKLLKIFYSNPFMVIRKKTLKDNSVRYAYEKPKYWTKQRIREDREYYSNIVFFRNKKYFEDNLGYIIDNFIKYGYSEKAKRETYYLLKYYLRRRFRRKKDAPQRWETLVKPEYPWENHKKFIINSKFKTLKLIEKDLYVTRLDNRVLEKKKSYKLEKPLDLDIILTMSEAEKHINIFYYNLLKYKFYRNFLNVKNELEISKLIQINVNCDIKNIKLNLNNSSHNWEKHFIIMNKLHKYICNLSLYNNKIDLLLLLWNSKTLTWFDLYMKLLKFVKIFIYWIYEKEFLNVFFDIIKLFF